MKRRVVVTGLGVVSALGTEIDEFWNAIKEGKCGITMVTKFDASNMPTKVAAEIKDFDPTKYIDKKEAKRMDPYCQYAMAASKMAVEMSGPWKVVLSFQDCLAQAQITRTVFFLWQTWRKLKDSTQVFTKGLKCLVCSTPYCFCNLLRYLPFIRQGTKDKV